jgi:hypothetical protein
MALEVKRHDQVDALEALERGEYEAISTSGQGALDELVHLALELGVFEALESVRVEQERAGNPDEQLLRVLAVLAFVEAIGLSAGAGLLSADAANLLCLGFGIQQVQNGFNKRHWAGAGKGEISKPRHPDVLREELARIDPGSMAAFRQQVIQQLFERGLVKGKT